MYPGTREVLGYNLKSFVPSNGSSGASLLPNNGIEEVSVDIWSMFFSRRGCRTSVSLKRGTCRAHTTLRWIHQQCVADGT